MQSIIRHQGETTYVHKGVTMRVTDEALDDMRHQQGLDPFVLIENYIDGVLKMENKTTGEFSVIIKISKDVSVDEFATHIRVMRIPMLKDHPEKYHCRSSDE